MIIEQIAPNLYRAQQGDKVAFAEFMCIAMIMVFMMEATDE